jgi:hypothetical protein
MSISLLSIQSEEAKCLKKGKYKLYFVNDGLCFTDGVNNVVLRFDSGEIISWTPESEHLYPVLPSQPGQQIPIIMTTLTAVLGSLISQIDLNRVDLAYKSDLTHKHVINDITDLLSWFESKRPELKGDKGDKGDKGETGDKGDRGYNSYEFWQLQTYGDITNENDRLENYFEAIKGEDGGGWLWDLLDSGITAAGLIALQTQVASLASSVATINTALGTVNVVGLATDVADIGADVLDNAGDILEFADDTLEAFETANDRINRIIDEAQRIDRNVGDLIQFSEFDQFLQPSAPILRSIQLCNTEDESITLRGTENPENPENPEDPPQEPLKPWKQYPTVWNTPQPLNYDTKNNIITKTITMCRHINSIYKEDPEDITTYITEITGMLKINGLFINEVSLEDILSDYANSSHQHSINDIIDYEPYNDAEL